MARGVLEMNFVNALGVDYGVNAIAVVEKIVVITCAAFQIIIAAKAPQGIIAAGTVE